MAFDYSHIGERIRYYRTKAGMSQTELASALYISSGHYISRLENGKDAPSLELIISIGVEGSGRSGRFRGFSEETVNQGAIGVVKIYGQALCGNGKLSQCWLLHESTPHAFSILVIL